MSTVTLESVVEKLSAMPEQSQRRVLAFIEALSVTKPVMPTNDGIASTAGCLSPEDADMMERVIREDFGRIHPDDWRDVFGQ